MFEIEVYCGGMFQTNGYLVTVGERRYLFDAPGEVTDWLAQSDRSLDGLILTHLHHDHVLDAGLIQKKFGCPIWSHSEPGDDLTLVSSLSRMMGTDMSIDEFTVDHLIAGKSELSLDGLDLSALHIPGHSPDSVTFQLNNEPVIIGGDVLFRGGIGRTDFPNGSHEQLITGIKEKLWPLPDETQVLPGHGPPTTIGEEKASNPFLR